MKFAECAEKSVRFILGEGFIYVFFANFEGLEKGLW